MHGLNACKANEKENLPKRVYVRENPDPRTDPSVVNLTSAIDPLVVTILGVDAPEK